MLSCMLLVVECITSVATVKHEESMMVWGCFYLGPESVTGTLSQKGKHRLLLCHAVLSAVRLGGQGLILPQDNGLKLTSRLCPSYIYKKK